MRTNKKGQEIARFWSKVDTTGGPLACWSWMACTKGSGEKHHYGSFSVKLDNGRRKMVYAHRYAFALVHGTIKKGLEVLHECDNPLCVNPSHLRTGTHAANMAEMAARGRVGRGQRIHRTIAERVRQDYAFGIKVDDIAHRYDISRVSVYRITSGQWTPKPENHLQVIVPPLGEPITHRGLISQ